MTTHAQQILHLLLDKGCFEDCRLPTEVGIPNSCTFQKQPISLTNHFLLPSKPPNIDKIRGEKQSHLSLLTLLEKAKPSLDT